MEVNKEIKQQEQRIYAQHDLPSYHISQENLGLDPQRIHKKV